MNALRLTLVGKKYASHKEEGGRWKLGICLIPRVSLSRHIHCSLHQPYDTPGDALSFAVFLLIIQAIMQQINNSIT